MEEKELQALLDKVDGKITNAIEAATKGYLTPEDLESKMAEMKVEDMTMKEVMEAVKTQGTKINEMINAQKQPEKKQTINEILTKVHPDLVKSVYDKGGSFKFKVNKTTVGLSSITTDPMGMFPPEIAEVQTQANRLAPSLNRIMIGTDSHGVIYWTDMTTRTNSAAARSDGSAAAEQVYAWTGYSETIDNISAMIPVHKEALKHISWMESELKRLLSEDCQEALDDYCYTGSGTAPQIGGIYTRATAFDAAAYVAAGGFTPIKANFFDLIVSMASNIMKETKYIVDRAWVNPYDANRMWLNKDANGVYTMPPFVVATPNGPVTVKGLQIIEANSVTAGTCVVGDSRKARLYDTGQVEIEVGYNLTGDFSKRILTILANMEVSLLIRNAEANAFLKSANIATDIAAIEYSGA